MSDASARRPRAFRLDDGKALGEQIEIEVMP